jgi:hypothetical protein
MGMKFTFRGTKIFLNYDELRMFEGVSKHLSCVL